jgi:Tfp pilus assembly protein PilX
MIGHFKNELNTGFALLYAIILISVISTIAFGIASISYKQKILASLAIDSGQAFYTADAGMECALYNNKSFPVMNSPIACTDPDPAKLGQILPLKLNTSKGPTHIIWETDPALLPRKESCFSVEYTMPLPPINKESLIVRGYNTCTPNPNRYVERTLRAYF